MRSIKMGGRRRWRELGTDVTVLEIVAMGAMPIAGRRDRS